MPLSKQRNRERMRQSRLHGYSVQPSIEGLKIEGNIITGITRPVIPNTVQPDIPWYNPSVHRPGDVVRVKQYNKVVTVTIPELDAEGNRIYE